MILYKGRILNPLSMGRFDDIVDGALLVDGSGKIVECGKFEALRCRADKIRDLGDKVIMPGLIDTHVHLPQYDIVGMDGYELLDWLNKYTFPAERRFESPVVAQEAASRFFGALKTNGTTTACVYSTVHKEATDRAFSEAERSGLRIFMGKVMMDRNSPQFLQEDTVASLRESEELCKKWHGRDGGRLNYVFTPRFAPTCSAELMRGAAELAKKYDAYIQTHLSENPAEIAWVKQLFPEASSYTEVYAMAGLLTPKTIMAHCIYIDDSEIRSLKNSSVGIAHCPSSNFLLRSGIFQADKMIGAGLKIGLGSDVGGGPNLSMFREMANACNMSKANFLRCDGGAKAVPPVMAFYLATMGGAEVLGVQDRIGNFAPGKEADFIVVDHSLVDPIRNSRARSGDEVLSQLIYRGDDRVVGEVYVRGRMVYSRGASTVSDSRHIMLSRMRHRA